MNKFSFSNKNIIILLKSFVLGGAEKQALHLSKHLIENCNCNVFIYSYIKSEQEHLFFKEANKLGLSNIHFVSNPLSASGKFKYIKRRIKIILLGFKLRKHKPDLIIPYLNPPSIIANLCYRIASAKVTFWHHRGPDYYRYDTIEKVASKRTKKFIANSIEGRDELVDILKINKDKAYFLPNFSTVAHPKIKESKNKDSIVIGMIAHFREEKLQLLLVKAFRKLLEKHSNIKLVLVGDLYFKSNLPEDYTTIKTIISENNLEKQISILHNTQSIDIIPKLDIGVLISKKEGMPNVIMEYMAHSLPIVTTNHSGCISLLGEEYPFLVNNDVDDIADKLESLLRDEDLRIDLGKQNSNRLREGFSIDVYLNNLTNIINE